MQMSWPDSPTGTHNEKRSLQQQWHCPRYLNDINENRNGGRAINQRIDVAQQLINESRRLDGVRNCDRNSRLR